MNRYFLLGKPVLDHAESLTNLSGDVMIRVRRGHERLWRHSPLTRRDASPLLKGGDAMYVTYSELFAYSLVIIGIVGLLIQIMNKK